MINYLIPFLIALLPFLVSISVPIVDSLYASDLVIIFLFIFLLFKLSRINNKNGAISIVGLRVFSLIIFLSFIIGKALFPLFFNYHVGSGVWGLFIFFITMLVIIPFGQNIIDSKKIQKVIVVVSLLAFLGLSLQYISYYSTNHFIKLIPLELYSQQVKELYSNVAITGIKNGQFRPSSFFLEPAHYAEYCSIGVASLLFSNWRKGHLPTFLAIVISFGIILSTSGLGIVLIGAIWLFKLIFVKKNRFQSFVIIASVFVILLISLPKTDFFNVIVSRVFNSDQSGNAIYARGNSYLSWLELNPFHKLFGIGYGLEQNIYMPGLSKYLCRIGLFGVAFLLFVVFQHYRFLNYFGKAMSLVWLLTFIMADISGVYYFVFYFLIIYSSKNLKKMSHNLLY